MQKSDTWDFNLQAFLPFLEQVVGELVELLGSVELGETRMRVMSALGIVVARVEGNVSSLFLFARESMLLILVSRRMCIRLNRMRTS